jgi:Rrf2 family protein
MFSKACEYAVRAVLYIAIKSADGLKPGFREVAKEIDAPDPFTGKILQKLVREGIISSNKGPNGGFYLEPDGKPVPLMDIVRVIDGKDVFKQCVLGLKECSDKFPCPIHHDVKAFRDKLKESMQNQHIQDLVKEIGEGKVFLKNHKLTN